MLATIADINYPYEGLIGEGWNSLAPGVRRSHSTPLGAGGKLRITGPTSFLGRRIAALMKLPPLGPEVQTRLQLESVGRSVRWVRTFGDMRAVSSQEIRAGSFVERAGPFRLIFRPQAIEGVLVHRQIGLTIFGLPAPRVLGPSVYGRIEAGPDDESWNVSVTISHPIAGKICRYEGLLTAE